VGVIISKDSRGTVNGGEIKKEKSNEGPLDTKILFSIPPSKVSYRNVQTQSLGRKVISSRTKSIIGL